MKRLFFAALTGTAIPAFWLSHRYRRDMHTARARLAAVECHVITTPWGAVEYAERGSGDPVLVVHGIFQHCAGGLLFLSDIPNRRFIAPSRFGYLGSSIPPNATVAAQADAFVALLDALDIRQIDVIGESAGATSALQLALRHPERVKHLAVLVGNFPGSPTAVVPTAMRQEHRSATYLVGAENLCPIDDGSPGGCSPESVRHDERRRPVRRRVHRQSVAHEP
jgi:pimeloyl-ACP methyl ester carboxylesterase